MARWHRSSEGPVPYGPPPEPRPDAEPTATPPPAEHGDAPTAFGPAPYGTPTPTLPPAPISPNPGPPAPPPLPGQPTFGGGPQPIAPWTPPPGAYTASVPGVVGLQYGRTLDRVMAYLLDGFIIAIPTLVIAFIVGVGAAGAGMRSGGVTLVAGIVGVGIHLLYFVSFWTGGVRATLGMRLMKLQIADARNGATLTVQQGLIRWLALGGAFQLIDLVPALTGLGVLVTLAWELVLLATTASSPTKQGLHDRMANTALVQPTGAQTPAVTCLVIVVALFALWIVGVVALVLLGTPISTSSISGVGTSI